MKKTVFIIIAVAIAAFLLGFVFGKNYHAHSSKDSVVGVYQTDEWNGKIGTLVLYEDGTCQYPSGGNATWVLEDDIVHITIERGVSVVDGTAIADTSEHEAKIMKNGLVLHGQFFEKVSD